MLILRGSAAPGKQSVAFGSGGTTLQHEFCMGQPILALNRGDRRWNLRMFTPPFTPPLPWA